ncbi:MAG: hypothetical protein WAW73_19660 [Rhodoferax sp.]
MNATLILWEIMCMALLWSVFCRSVRADKTTKLDVRLALLAVGTSALAGMAAPVYGWVPDRVTLAIVGAIVFMQAVMAQHWRHGVPHQFIKDDHRPRRRAGDTP